MENEKKTSLYLPVELYERLRLAALAENKKPNAIVIDAIREWLATRGYAENALDAIKRGML